MPYYHIFPLLLVALFLATPSASADELVVFVSEDSPIKELLTNMPPEEIADIYADIYMGQKVSFGSVRVQPAAYIQGDDPTSVLLKSAITPSNSVRAVVDYVRSVNGGVGFVYGPSGLTAAGVAEVYRVETSPSTKWAVSSQREGQ